MKSKLIVFFLVFSINSLAQERLFFGRVVDDQGYGIPYAIVEVIDRFDGAYCDTNGVFSFHTKSDSMAGLKFYRQGYADKNIALKNLSRDSIIVVLKKKELPLSDFTVSGKKRKKRDGILGKENLKYNGGCYMTYGDEIAIYLEPKHSNGTLKELFFYITNEGNPDAKFRVHIYGKDSTAHSIYNGAREFPGHDLTDSEIVVHGATGNEWVPVDVSDKNINVGDGIFVSVQWVLDYGNVEEPWIQKELSQYYISGRSIDGRDFNGQVLGLTWSYGLMPRTYVSFKRTHDVWEDINFINSRHRFLGITTEHQVNAMIYATYNYTKK